MGYNRSSFITYRVAAIHWTTQSFVNIHETSKMSYQSLESSHFIPNLHQRQMKNYRESINKKLTLKTTRTVAKCISQYASRAKNIKNSIQFMLNIVWFDFSKKNYVFYTRPKIVSINNKPFESSRSVQMSRISGIMVFFARVLPISMW